MSDTQNKDILEDAVSIFNYLISSLKENHTQFFRITMFEIKDGERSTGKFTPCLCELIFEDDDPNKEIIDIRPICELLAAPVKKVFEQYNSETALKTYYTDITLESEAGDKKCPELENLLESFSRSKDESLH